MNKFYEVEVVSRNVVVVEVNSGGVKNLSEDDWSLLAAEYAEDELSFDCRNNAEYDIREIPRDDLESAIRLADYQSLLS